MRQSVVARNCADVKYPMKRGLKSSRVGSGGLAVGREEQGAREVDEFLGLDRLEAGGDIHTFVFRLRFLQAAEHHDRKRGGLLTQLLDQFGAAHLRHAVICDHHAEEFASIELCQGSTAALRDNYGEVGLFKNQAA